ncbi:MAG: nuclear transport factor 2 family protein [Bryobacteraceae bacterium]|jgi:ketosteroid isomerase-like protein
MTQSEALAWANRWIANWNRRDVDSVLAHFANNVEFTSPRAVAIMGKARLSGKRELAEYWTRALAAIGSLHFTLDHVITDGDRLGITYTSETNGNRLRACELLVFDDSGRVCGGEAMYGASL